MPRSSALPSLLALLASFALLACSAETPRAEVPPLGPGQGGGAPNPGSGPGASDTSSSVGATPGSPTPSPTAPPNVGPDTPAEPTPRDMAKASWSPMSTVGAPADAECPSAVWTGSKMLVVGGSHSRTLVTAYDPVTDTWTSLPSNNMPPGRVEASAVWTGSKLIQWGGRQVTAGCSPFCWYYEGYTYDPDKGSWTQNANAPVVDGLYFARFGHAAVWTGTKMFVYGGNFPSIVFGLAQTYDPTSNQWAAAPTAPEARSMVAGTMMGDKALFWGGADSVDPSAAAAAYEAVVFDPTTQKWSAALKPSPLKPRAGVSLVWTGREAVVWGGTLGAETFGDGAAYNPQTGVWSMLPTAGAPSARRCAASVWTGKETLVWGGVSGGKAQASGAILR